MQRLVAAAGYEVSQRIAENYVPVPESGCWLWLGDWNSKGYGRTAWTGKRPALIHRLFFEIHIGKIPQGMLVLHRCDTPACCNPSHLFLGDDASNAADRDAKHRGWIPRGSLNVKAKLDSEQVASIRGDMRLQRVIALSFGVSNSTICSIKTGRTWGHLLNSRKQ